MIGRLLEDGVWVARFAWNYYKAPSRVRNIGFYNGKLPVPKRERIKYAWRETNGFGKQRSL